MKCPKHVYVVTMYRFGDREKHSYVLGAFTSYDKAWAAGENEEEYRGGKYKWEYVAAELDKVMPDLISQQEKK